MTLPVPRPATTKDTNTMTTETGDTTAHLTIAARPFTVHGSEAHGYTVLTTRIPTDPTHAEGGYNEAGFDRYPWAGVARIESRDDRPDARAAWGIEPPYNTGWYAYDAEWAGWNRAEHLLGYARTPADAWQVAAEALAKRIAKRFAAT